jgi:hypothetical protein
MDPTCHVYYTVPEDTQIKDPVEMQQVQLEALLTSASFLKFTP